MKNALVKKGKNNRGFTLIELVVVIAIIGILAIIAIPRVSSARKDAAINAHNANVRALENAASMYIAEKGIPESDKEDLGEDDLGEYLQDWPTVPKGAGIDKEGETYTVTIKQDGKIKVKPGKYPEDSEQNPKDPE